MSASEIRGPAFRHSASLRAFTPVFDGLWTRVNALMAHAGYDIRTERGNEGGELRLVHHRVAQNADLRRRDCVHVGVLARYKGISLNAGYVRICCPYEYALLLRV